MNTTPATKPAPLFSRLNNECTGECPCGCGEEAFAYATDGADGYVDAAPACALNHLVDAGFITPLAAAMYRTQMDAYKEPVR